MLTYWSRLHGSSLIKEVAGAHDTLTCFSLCKHPRANENADKKCFLAVSAENFSVFEAGPTDIFAEAFSFPDQCARCR